MIKVKSRLKFGLLIISGFAVLLWAGVNVQAAVTVYDNTGSGTASFDNNNYTSTTGMTMKTGSATQGGTSLSDESGVSLAFNSANLTTQYNADTTYNSNNNLEAGSGTGAKLNITNGLMTNGNPPYTGGYIKVAGTLGFTANIKSSLDIKEVEAGNYGAMVKVTLPTDVDASQLQDAIKWDKAYFSLTLSPPLSGLIGTPNFPMQFDHHVYLDPDNKNIFYLKVKGIPIQAVTSGSSAYLKMMRSQDQTDLANNMTSAGNQLKPTALATAGVTSKTNGAGLVVPGGYDYGFSVLFNPSLSPSLINYGSAMQAQGDIGWSFAMVKNFSALGFSNIQGTANINFYVDVAKYQGNVADHSPNKQLTAGKLPPSPRADGLFAMKIGVYGTDQLKDPFSSSASRTTAGKTPLEYALVDPAATPLASTLTTNMTSWNAYVSPWDTKQSLNTATSAWESVGGVKTRLNNISLADTLTDRTVTLNALTDGILVTKGKGSDVAGTDYSGTTAPILGAVGTDRFARVVDYFDTTTGDATTAATDKILNTKATLTTKAYTAATAGQAAPSTDPSLTLPTTDTTANKNYLYYTGTSTSTAGTAIPILGAPLFFTQTNLPAAPTINWNSDNVYYIKKSEITAGKTVTLKGTWADDYANTDTLSASDDKSGNTLNDFAKVETTDNKTFSLAVTSGVKAATLNLGSAGTVSGLHTITATIQRPALKLANGETLIANASAKAVINVYVVDDSVDYQVTAQKYIANNGNQLTQQYVHGPTAGNDQTGDTLTMVAVFTNNGSQTITTPIVVVPLAAQLQQVGTPTVTVNGKVVTAQVVPLAGYFNIVWPGPIVKGDKVVVKYQVQAVEALPTLGLTPADVLMDQSAYVGATNKVTLLPAATTGSVEITPPTNLEFGTHAATPGVYKNIDGDKTLLVTDNRVTPGPWTITAQLSAFAAGSRQLTGETAKIDFGTPALNSAVFTAGGSANKLLSYDYADKQTSMAYTFKNIQLQLAGNAIQPGDYHATITYSWTNGVE
ncbi:hypothetical protein [Loigolactobacillus binensis]|uniref:WxL domain-containing protein n=1 Tax=Loigolactobacillus binensis TaxID=2559922 RepID=A0ABW3ECJ0_9LACO|nr:hypothetical protein [Loigolactobacillus binensis]